MSAKKLGRLAGFIFVLTAVLGSPVAASDRIEQKVEVSVGSTVSASELLGDIVWS